MNLRKSVNIALANNDMTKKELAAKMGISRTRLYSILGQKRMNPDTMEMLANAFEMKVSALIELGE